MRADSTLTTRPPASLSGPRFGQDLGRWGDRVAVVTESGQLTYRQLESRVLAAEEAFRGPRHLVVMAAENSAEWLVDYLAAMRSGQVVLLAPGDRPEHLEGLIQTYRPATVVRRQRERWGLTRHRTSDDVDLHPELALLLTTSGSTGSPKLVRLSGDNLEHNAASIVEALALSPADRAMATLPTHYSYGLSIVHSHLACGGSLVLTDHSVIDPCYWEILRRSGATGIAGVPHTYDLLERVGLADLDVPSVRTLTQAGGPLSAGTAARFRSLAADRGWRFFTMYGQTEATARMAVLTPELARTHPDAVGVAVPGGHFRVSAPSTANSAEAPAAPGVGELVYSGPNVMLGYASTTTDLGRGRDLDELHTGDLGTVDEDGVVRVLGRRSRFAKVLGLRVDLDHLEGDLADPGSPVWCADLDGRLGLLTPQPGRAESLRRAIGDRHGIPVTAVTVLDGVEPPLLATGKPDYVGIRRLLQEVPSTTHQGADACSAVVGLYRSLLRRPDADETTSFVQLDGDSLSYVEVSVRLEEVLGALPTDWHRLTPKELVDTTATHAQAGRPPARPRWRRLETNVVIRALAVLLILANHTKLADLPGGAHTLLVIAGFNLARFQLTHRPPRQRAAGILQGALRIWAPSAFWIAVVALVAGTYDWRNVLLLNQVLGDWSQWSPHWHFWFIEALVALLVGSALLCLVPGFDRLEREHPFGVPMALVGLGLLTRYAVVIPDAGPYRGANALVLTWLFATGWAASRATTARQRLLVSAVPVLTLPGFWPTMPGREATIIAGVLLLIWLPTVPVPAFTARAFSSVASASLFVYLTHFAVYPHVMAHSSGLAVLASLAAGLAYWQAWERARSVVRRAWGKSARWARRVGRAQVTPEWRATSRRLSAP